MATRILHVSDLHAGRRDTPGLGEALTALVDEIDPELVIATGDLAHRGRSDQFERARTLLTGLGRPLLAVPGNHDIPYAFPGRFSRPWREFEAAFGAAEPAYRSESVLVCGLNSVRPWRHQGGLLTPAQLERAAETLHDATPGALRVVALHHHLAGAPWRASRKFPLRHRDRALEALADAGADLIVGGHIHQCVVVARQEFEVVGDDTTRSVVLATAPGVGRPRPHRSGEAQGAMVYEWDADRLTVLTYLLRGDSFTRGARREFARDLSP